MKKSILITSIGLLSAFSLSSCSLFSNSSDNDYENPNSSAEVVEITSSYTDVKNNVYNSCYGVRNMVTSSSYKVGSCVCIKTTDDYAYFLTNRHVIEAEDETKESDNLSIYFGNGAYKSGTLICTTTYSQRTANEADDLAIIRTSNPSGYTVTPVTFTTSTMSKGASCVSIGCPVNLSNFNTFTTGVISKVLSNDLVMHTATINPGNSGGGLFNLKSELIGLNVSRTEQSSSGTVVQDMYYAISIDHINSFLKSKSFEI